MSNLSNRHAWNIRRRAFAKSLLARVIDSEKNFFGDEFFQRAAARKLADANLRPRFVAPRAVGARDLASLAINKTDDSATRGVARLDHESSDLPRGRRVN